MDTSDRLPAAHSHAPLDEAFVHDFLGRLAKARSARDTDRIVSFCTEDVKFDDIGEAKALIGREALREYLKGIYSNLSDIRLEEPESYLSFEGTRVAARWKVVGLRSHPPGGQKEIEIAEFFEFQDRLVSRWTFMVRDLDFIGRQWSK